MSCHNFTFFMYYDYYVSSFVISFSCKLFMSSIISQKHDFCCCCVAEISFHKYCEAFQYYYADGRWWVCSLWVVVCLCPVASVALLSSGCPQGSARWPPAVTAAPHPLSHRSPGSSAPEVRPPSQGSPMFAWVQRLGNGHLLVACQCFEAAVKERRADGCPREVAVWTLHLLYPPVAAQPEKKKKHVIFVV